MILDVVETIVLENLWCPPAPESTQRFLVLRRAVSTANQRSLPVVSGEGRANKVGSMNDDATSPGVADKP